MGSKSLAAKGFFGISGATIRNEMRQLERDGYIFQPHTSAGRVPTEKGYAFYVANYIFDGQKKKSKSKLNGAAKTRLDEIILRVDGEEELKELAKILAELSSALVILAFDSNRFYYTGLSYLYDQPEFATQAAVTTVSQALDHCDEIIPSVFQLINQEKKFLIGQENPFGAQCSFAAAPLNKGLVGMLGPLRMDYDLVFNLIDYVWQKFYAYE